MIETHLKRPLNMTAIDRAVDFQKVFITLK